MKQSTPDYTMMRYLLIAMGMVIVAVIVADAASEGDSGPLVSTIVAIATPITAALILAAKGKEVADNVQAIKNETAAQTAKIDKVDRAVNGDLDRRIEAAVCKALATHFDGDTG